MRFTTTTSLTTLAACSLLFAAGQARAGEVQIGVSPAQAEGVSYLAPTAANRRQARLLETALGDRLQGPLSLRRVRFEYDDDELSGTRFEVRGVLFGWSNLRVASYQVADLSQAIGLANHDRDDPRARRVIEVRGARVVVFSGAGTQDPGLVAAARARAWPKTAGSVDLLALQDSPDSLLFSFSEGALLASPPLHAILNQHRTLIKKVALLDPTATLSTQGDQLRLDAETALITQTPLTMGIYTDAAQEQAYAAYFAALTATPEPGETGGMTQLLPEALPEAPAVIGAAQDGQTLRVRVGDTVRVALSGNPGSSGYSWTLESPLERLRLVQDAFVPNAPSGGPVGGGGQFRFELVAESAGTQELRFVERRPWESEGVETFRVTLRVE